MAQVRKTSSSSPAPAVVHDITERRSRVAPARSSKETDSAGAAGGAPGSQDSRAAEAAPQDRATRIEALKQQIARGEYDPDPEEIARKLLDRGF